MMTDQQAIDRALAYLADNHVVDDDVRLVVRPEWIRRMPGVVVVGYNSAEFVETGDPAARLVGNMPIRVEESTGDCRALSMNEYFELYEAT
ncbi:YrhB domain-containing protein [Micromonospora sp. NPDC049051]|uniref:YrhB domain-containing protein n=1 Tax=Micromonospora sp. NPDC049051 TaxID=3364264 RepID=UPI003723DD86